MVSSDVSLFVLQIFTAPYGYFICGYVIPWLKTLAKANSAGALAI